MSFSLHFAEIVSLYSLKRNNSCQTYNFRIKVGNVQMVYSSVVCHNQGQAILFIVLLSSSSFRLSYVREYRKGNQNEQSRETCNIGYTARKQKQRKNKLPTFYVLHLLPNYHCPSCREKCINNVTQIAYISLHMTS